MSDVSLPAKRGGFPTRLVAVVVALLLLAAAVVAYFVYSSSPTKPSGTTTAQTQPTLAPTSVPTVAPLTAQDVVTKSQDVMNHLKSMSVVRKDNSGAASPANVPGFFVTAIGGDYKKFNGTLTLTGSEQVQGLDGKTYDCYKIVSEYLNGAGLKNTLTAWISKDSFYLVHNYYEIENKPGPAAFYDDWYYAFQAT